jgi:hypothetical protein
MCSMKKGFISGQTIIVLKNFKQLKTIGSYSVSSEALAHNGQISKQKSLIGCETSYLYLLE